MDEEWQTIDEAGWHRAFERVRRLSPERFLEIVDFLDFMWERHAEDGGLDEETREAIARHLAGDRSDTIPFEQVRREILGPDAELPQRAPGDDDADISPAARPRFPVADEGAWRRAYDKFRQLAPEQQDEILDYIGFVTEEGRADSWRHTSATAAP